MDIYVVNKTSFGELYMEIDGKEYPLSKNKTVNVHYEGNEIHVSFIIKDKNKLFVDIIDLFCGTFKPKGSCSYVNCNCNFVLSSENNVCKLGVFDLKESYNKQLVFKSVFVEGDGALLKDINYELTDINKIQKKHGILHFFVLSLLPLLIVNFYALISYCEISDILTFLLLLLFFAIPSFREIREFRNNCKSSTANSTLIKSCKQRASRTKTFEETMDWLKKTGDN